MAKKAVIVSKKEVVCPCCKKKHFAEVDERGVAYIMRCKSCLDKSKQYRHSMSVRLLMS